MYANVLVFVLQVNLVLQFQGSLVSYVQWDNETGQLTPYRALASAHKYE